MGVMGVSFSPNFFFPPPPTGQTPGTVQPKSEPIKFLLSFTVLVHAVLSQLILRILTWNCFWFFDVFIKTLEIDLN